MGSAAITIQHPPSLEHGIPYLESGKEVPSSMVRPEKAAGEDRCGGTGGRITFKKVVLDSEWTYKYTKSSSLNTNLTIGDEIMFTSAAAENTVKLAAEVGMSVSEARECFTLIKSRITDDNKYSELYAYVDYEGKNVGRWWWTQNGLGLKAKIRWAEDSEMIIDVTF